LTDWRGSKIGDPAAWSSLFIDFMDRCLDMDPVKRPMASVLRSHPFLRFACPTKNLTPVILKVPHFQLARVLKSLFISHRRKTIKAKEELLQQDADSKQTLEELLDETGS
jgi:serine/threonine protein kinase